ncbi:MAG TPA: hypothetical protein VFS21_13595 [Roseiflexaceae bacterium]|nr:hypothetical protein [Roseiflexaceae bacterium]
MDPRDLQQHNWERLDEADAHALAGALAAVLPLPYRRLCPADDHAAPHGDDRTLSARNPGALHRRDCIERSARVDHKLHRATI